MLQDGLWMSLLWTRRRRRDAEAGEIDVARQRDDAHLREAAHMLRTPLAVARAHLRLALESLEEGSLERADALVALDEIDRAAQIADELLMLGTTAARDARSAAPVDLAGLAVETAARWGAASGHDVGADARAAVPVIADAAQLRHALDALVENALRVCGPEDRITIAAREEDGHAVLAVTDTGTGIPAHDLERIFERFARGTSAAGRGTGLGLAIVRAIAESHGGGVSVASRLGRGSTFTLRLGPVLRGDAQAAAASAHPGPPDAAPQVA